MGRRKGRDSSRRRRRGESTVLLAALLGLLAAPAATQDENILDWLSGGSGAPAEAPQEAPAGDAADAAAPAGQPPEAAPATDPPAPPAPGEAPAARPGRASPAAQACADALREALLLELQVQDVEFESLDPGDDPASLKGFRKQRWERIQKDRAGFRQQAGQVSLQGLVVPRPADAVDPPRELVALLLGLERAYEASRELRPIEQYMELNREFVKSGDWARRDRAVQERDALIAREVDFARLMQDAATLHAGTGDAELLARFQQALAELAPAEQALGDDVAVMVLRDDGLREQVMAEVGALLTTVKPPPPPPAPDAELRPQVVELQAALIEQAGLADVIKGLQGTESQLELIDAELQADLPLDRRKEYVGRRTNIVATRDEQQRQWYSTEPDPATFDALVARQDELIARRMLDLGPSGVLYGARVQALRDVRDEGLPDSARRWQFLEQQQELLSLLDGLQPTENPLLGLELPDVTGLMLIKEAQAKVAAEKAALAKSAPKPGAGKKQGGGKAAPGKQHLAPKPKKPPAKKPPPKQGGKGKGKGQKPY
jgi:hypothetical protein